MNERIRELVEQAGAIPIHGDFKNRALVGLDNIEKFAEMIVRECAAVCEDIAGLAEATNSGDTARKTKATAISCSNFIKSRFGVSE